MNARRLAAAGASLLVATSIACRRSPPTPAVPQPDCLRLEAPTAPVGFDAAFSVRATLTCGATGGGVEWRQTAGPALRGAAASPDGMTFTARMPPLADVLGAAPPWGVVPLSPATRGEVVIEATWTGDAGRRLRAEARVAGASRSRGVPNTPVGARVHLGGDGWHITARPAGSAATLDMAAAGAASLLPDVSGDWRLADRSGHTLALRSARYDETPLDCGRAGCHVDIATAAARSPMTTVMARGLARTADAGRAFGPDYPTCAIACHATGEPGLSDGGFTHVATELGPAGDPRRSWDELPGSLRRLGGVGCLACHGPAAIPATSARWSVLRADVCAVCHDAPPRYGHVAAWRSTRMAHADRDTRAASDRACVSCHTTWGFLATLQRFPGERDRPVDRRPPAHAGQVGITCAACHAVHSGETGGPVGALLRTPPAPPLLASAVSGSGAAARTAVCLPCHTPDTAAGRPRATAAALMFARGGLDPASGHPLNGTPAHATVSGGCVGCHRGGSAAVERGAGHAFQAQPAVCVPCHPTALPPSDLPQEARRLWNGWRGDADTAAFPHATSGALDLRTPVGRALWNVLLVLEDPAAAAHNARYARALLAASAPVLSVRSRR